MRESRVISDFEAIELLIEWTDDSLSDTARLLSRYSDTTITVQQVHHWRSRGRIAGHKRLLFLMAFNDELPDVQLPLTWLATPAQRQNGGRHHGGKVDRPAAPAHRGKDKAKRRAGARPRPQLGVGAA